ncbi:hypothetical protein SEA_MUSETTA_31 [Microbacterium phage Musetta]|nr:hypothetical protein SEA_MUSETTA_31 [Microbacterium phage Musetta]QYC54150.1 hypothetical protein SEA_WELCOME_32 [Microbacterium phage Welcome]UVK62445.1 hypothetical protein SEA_YUMA_30 [Microbacterium phage Yuma]
MTAFNPLVAARILQEGPLRRLEREHQKLVGEHYRRMLNGQPPWHRTMHELESLADAAFDRYWSLKEHIAWLYAEGTDRLADLGMSR